MATATRYQGNVYVAPCDVGRGVFAARDFSSGERILTFQGFELDASDPMNHSEQQGNLLQIGERRYLLPEPPGLFVNHSCRPNAGIIHDTVLIALAAITRGQEVRFDYSTTMDEDAWTMPCSCGSPTCRGIVRDFKYLPPQLRTWYLERGVVQSFIAHKCQPAP